MQSKVLQSKQGKNQDFLDKNGSVVAQFIGDVETQNGLYTGYSHSYPGRCMKPQEGVYRGDGACCKEIVNPLGFIEPEETVDRSEKTGNGQKRRDMVP
jgi:hypothetical protein